MHEIISSAELTAFVEANQPPFPLGTFAYCEAAVAVTAQELRRRTDEQAADPDAHLVVEDKVNSQGVESPVTDHDKNTELILGALLVAANHRVKGEEGTANWPEGEIPIATHIVDPIDGTRLFTAYMEQLRAWMQLPEAGRPPRPVCPSMLSDGVVLRDRNMPVWASIAAPFLHPDGIIRWSAGPEVEPVRIEPDGSRHLLAPANTLSVPDIGGVVLVASNSTEKALKEPLQRSSFTVAKIDAVVAAGLCVMDDLFGRVGSTKNLAGKPIVGAVAHTAQDWDVAGLVALANHLGFFVTDIRGEPRTTGTGSIGLVLAANRQIGETILQAK